MSELYDNEWTDAFSALQNLGKNDQKVVKILLDTFLVCIHDTPYCLSVACMEPKKTIYTQTITLYPLEVYVCLFPMYARIPFKYSHYTF